MNYKGTIAYRSNLGTQVNEGFLHSVVLAWDFLLRNDFDIKELVEGYSSIPVIHFMRGLSCIPSESANQIADTFLGDWVLMLDTDHVFGADAFYEMLRTFEENKLDVLVGFTQKRVAPYHPVLYKTDFNAFEDFETIFPNPIERQTLLPIDSSGCACLMVRRIVFDRIKECGERPFDPRKKFNSPFMEKMITDLDNEDPENVSTVLMNQTTLIPPNRWKDETFAEDTSFFWRCKMLGIEAYCAPWIKFHHLATVMVEESMIQKKDNVIPR